MQLRLCVLLRLQKSSNTLLIVNAKTRAFLHHDRSQQIKISNPYRSGECRDWRKVKTQARRQQNRERWRLFEKARCIDVAANPIP